MENRKKVEIEYYDKRVNDFGNFDFLTLNSYQFLYKLLEESCREKIVLDYGCGSGLHTIKIAKMGAKKVIGIDLSEKSLQVARERAKRDGLDGKVEFLKMDCEKMDFPDNYFDVIFDGGTFSSIDLKQAWLEISRVLKPDGVLIGIETFGHNPITNLKRKLNKLTGKRTEWATAHIFRVEDLVQAKRHFRKVSVHYFHLVSFLAFPFLKFPGGKLLLKTLEFVDRTLFKISFLRKYAFKVVFKLYAKKII